MYLCSTEFVNNTQILIKVPEHECDTANTILGVVIIVVGSVYVIIGVLIFLLWKHKFYSKTFAANCKSGKNTSQTFWYDVFFSYCGENDVWLRTFLLPELEDVHGFCCCVHQRDFPIGESLRDVIYEHMKHSRVIIIFLSCAALNKPWPVFERKTARSMEITDGKSVIYVLLEKPQTLGSNLPCDVREVLSSRIYIEWPTGNESNSLMTKRKKFFDKLSLAVRKKVGKTSCPAHSSIGRTGVTTPAAADDLRSVRVHEAGQSLL